MFRSLSRALLPPLLFSALACVWTWPLVLNLSSRLPGHVAGDNIAFLWNTWWARQVVAGSHDGFFLSPLLFAPFGFDLTLHTHTALQGMVSAWLLGSLSPLAAQNVLILATLTLNGLLAYVFARDRTNDRASALVAGIVFGGSPYVAAHLLGHFSLISTWVLPAFLICASRAVERRSPAWSAMAGAALVATAYTDYYYLAYSLVLAAGLLGWDSGLLEWRWRPALLSRRTTMSLAAWIGAVVALTGWIRATGGFDTAIAGIRVQATDTVNLETAGWLTVLAGVWLRLRPSVGVHVREALPVIAARLRLGIPGLLVAGAGLLPLVMGAARMWVAGDYTSPVHFWRSGPAGIDVASFVLGNPFHPITGAWTTGMYERLGIDRVEGTAWLGVAPMVMLLAGVVRARADRSLRAPLVAGALFFVLALGGWLTAAGVRTGILLPANFAGFVPIFSNARIPGRAVVVTILAIAIISARLIKALPQERRALWAVGIGVVVLADYVPAPYPSVALETPALYERLAAMPGGTVVELPMGLRDGFEQVGMFDDRTLLYQMTHGHPLVGGFAARVPESIKQRYRDLPVVRSLLRLSDTGGDAPDARDADLTRDQTGARLREVDVRFVVLDRSRATAQLQAFVERQLPLTLIASEGQRDLFEVDGR